MKNFKNEFSIEELQDREEFTALAEDGASCDTKCQDSDAKKNIDDMLSKNP